jgi:hypothetical protein
VKIHWENINWETDDVGTSWATLADAEHNSLTLENRDGTITFHTDGNPRFDVSTVLDITAVCMILSKNALDQPGPVGQGGATSRSAPEGASEVLVPEQRQASLGQQHDAERHASRLT